MMPGYTAAFVYLILLTAGIYLFAYGLRRASALYVTLQEIAVGTVVSTIILVLTENLSLPELNKIATQKKAVLSNSLLFHSKGLITKFTKASCDPYRTGLLRFHYTPQ